MVWSHKLTIIKKGSEKQYVLRLVVTGKGNKLRVILAKTKGWKARLISKLLRTNKTKTEANPIELPEGDAIRLYVAMKALARSPNMEKGALLVDAVESMSDEEVHFWAWKILDMGSKASAALRRLYS
jgi:hypothetical protein